MTFFVHGQALCCCTPVLRDLIHKHLSKHGSLSRVQGCERIPNNSEAETKAGIVERAPGRAG